MRSTLTGTCQNDSEDECASACPASEAIEHEDHPDDEEDDQAIPESRKLLSFSQGAAGDTALLWHIQSTLSAPVTDLLLGPVAAVHSIGSGQRFSGMPCSFCLIQRI